MDAWTFAGRFAQGGRFWTLLTSLNAQGDGSNECRTAPLVEQEDMSSFLIRTRRPLSSVCQQEDMSGMEGLFNRFNRWTISCLLVEGWRCDMSDLFLTGRHVFLFNRNTCSSMLEQENYHLVATSIDMSSCWTWYLCTSVPGLHVYQCTRFTHRHMVPSTISTTYQGSPGGGCSGGSSKMNVQAGHKSLLRGVDLTFLRKITRAVMYYDM